VGLCLGASVHAATGAVANPTRAEAGTVTLAFSQFEHAGAVHDVEWQLPAAAPGAWLLLQHGFARRCANLRATAAHLARAGVATLCVNADMGGGSPALADALAAWLADPKAASPDGRPAAPRLIVAGHSAGALFALRVGRPLAAAQPGRLAGALLWDPVGGAALADALSAVAMGGQRPVLALLAPPLRCNAAQSARPALVRAQREARAAGGHGALVVEFGPGATHVDIEGEDTEAIAVWACGDGWPRTASTAVQRAMAARWAAGLAQGQGATALAAGLAQLPAIDGGPPHRLIEAAD
jgi:hypothetical protein